MKSLNQLAGEGIKYVVIKQDETGMWKADIVKKAKKIEGVYLVDLTQPTHLCELAISYPYECLKNMIDNYTAFDEDTLTELENENLDNGYFTGNSTFNIEKAYNDERDFEEVYEYERGNPTIC